ncbi:PHP domain-containing protein [Clostridium cuniculi]|nr:PHP domain-containing protein [Clostridium cuniculi]
MENNYVKLHLHTSLSNLFTTMDSITNYKQFIDRAKECGMKAIAFSEHGNVCSWINKYNYCKENGIKYIHGVEAYITETLDEKIRDNKHCCLYALNLDGVYEINYLMSHKVACNRKDNHFYYNPRISLDELFNISDNIVVTSACIGGILGSSNVNMKNRFIEWLKNRKEGLAYLEIQHHETESQKRYNLEMLRLSKETGIPLIAGTDTHSLDSIRVDGTKVLQTSKNIKYNDDEESFDLTFKTYEELIKCYERQNVLPIDEVLEAIENTNKVADMVEGFELDKSIKYPKMYDNSLEVLKVKIREGLRYRRKYIKDIPKDVLNDRINSELKTIKQVGAVDFILLEEYVKRNARINGIYPGYSRGSCSGSFICYLLGITEINSIKFGMNFFRFINPNRVSMMDVDSDWFDEDKEWVQHFLLEDEKFNASYIVTYNTIAFKGAARDVGRAFKVPSHLVDEISNSADDEEALAKLRIEHEDLFKYIDILKGTVVSFGSHPAGIIVSDRDIAREIGTITLSTNDYPVSCCDMKEVDSCNWVKLDCLGLANMGVINKCCEMAGIERLTPDNVDLEDENVWMSIAKDNRSIFQWESKMAQGILENMFSDETLNRIKSHTDNFSYLKWFSFGNGLLRPSCASFRDEASLGIAYDNGLEEINSFLSSTLGRLTFQEQIMRWCVEFCGYSEAESDSVRRAIAKKKGTEQLLPEIERRFIETCNKKYGTPISKLKEVVKPFLQVIIDASEYGFSENHSDPYSMIGYILGYLRYYYPVEYIASSLNAFSDNKYKEKRAEVTQMAKDMNIVIKPPKFRYSKAEYLANKVDKSIYKGVGSISYLNYTVADELYELRNNKYDSFVDLLKDLDSTSINSRQLDILIRLDFFSKFGKSKKLIKIVKLYNEIVTKKQFKKDKLPYGISSDIFRKYSDKETDKMFKDVNVIKLVSDITKQIPDKDITLSAKLKAQKDYLGYIDYENEDLKNYGYILEINDKYTPRIKVHRIDTGNIIEYKISRRIYKGLNEDDLIYIYGTEEKIGSKKVGEKLDTKTGKMKPIFEKDPNKIELWISEYELVNTRLLK